MRLKNYEKLKSGKSKLVVAVSGGVDSVALLDLLVKQTVSPSTRLVVAHFDHGIREDSSVDARFVEGLARQYALKFFTKQGKLGKNASEDTARQARYQFLVSVKDEVKAKAIITAHHRDDVLETIVMNIMRGTARRGLSSLQSRPGTLRPLIGATKAQIYTYALKNHLEWVEDWSNLSKDYKRNQIRLEVLPKLRQKNPKLDEKLMKIYEDMIELNQQIDESLEVVARTVIQNKPRQINRVEFIKLDPNIRRELLMWLIRQTRISVDRIDSKNIAKLEHFVCTSKPGKRFSPAKNLNFLAKLNQVEFEVVS